MRMSRFLYTQPVLRLLILSGFIFAISFTNGSSQCQLGNLPPDEFLYGPGSSLLVDIQFPTLIGSCQPTTDIELVIYINDPGGIGGGDTMITGISGEVVQVELPNGGHLLEFSQLDEMPFDSYFQTIYINPCSFGSIPSDTIVYGIGPTITFETQFPSLIGDCQPSTDIELVIYINDPGGMGSGDTIVFGTSGEVVPVELPIGEHLLEFSQLDEEPNDTYFQSVVMIDACSPDTFPPVISTGPNLFMVPCTTEFNSQVFNTSCIGPFPPLPAEVCAEDLCDGTVSVQFSTEVIQDGATTTTRRVWYAEDFSGNADSVVHTIIAIDTDPPVINSTPPDITISVNEPCDEQYVLDLPQASDDCTSDLLVNITVTPDLDPPSLIDDYPLSNGTFAVSLPPGNSIVVFEVIDNAGFTAETSYSVFVDDNVIPVIDPISDITISSSNGQPGDCFGDLNFNAPNVTDNCSSSSDIYFAVCHSGPVSDCIFPEPGGPISLQLEVGTYTFIYFAEDMQGNSADQIIQTVVIEDDELELSCPSSTSIPTSSSSEPCMGLYALSIPSPVENCGIQDYTLSYSGATSGGPMDVNGGDNMDIPLNTGVTTFTLEVTDINSNMASCMFEITTIDDLPPDWSSLPDPLLGECGVNDLGQLLEDNVDELIDDCTPSSYGYSVTSSNVPCGLSMTGSITIVVSDENGNSALLMRDFELTDNLPPLLDADPSLIVNCTDDIPLLQAEAQDLCDNDVEVVVETINEDLPDGGYITHYTWTATDDCGNSSTATSQVTVTNDYEVAITDENGDDVPVFICPGESIVILAVSDDIIEDYIWNTGEQTESILATAGEYSVTATTSNGCNAEATVILTEGVSFEVNISQTPDDWECGVDAVTLTASTDLPDGATYSWNTGETGESIEVDAAGVYTVTATEIGGSECSGIAEYTLSNPDNNTPNVIIMPYEDLSCDNETVELIATSENNEDEFVWMVDPAVESNILTVSQPGDYTLMVTGPNNCDTMITVNVDGRVAPLPVSFTPGVYTCNDLMPTIAIDTIIENNWTFDWNGPGEIQEIGNNDVQVTAPGTYTVMVTDEFACTSTYDVIVEADTTKPDVAASAEPDVITCLNTSALLIGESEMGLEERWTNEIGIEVPSTVTLPGNYTYTVVDVNGNGCSNQISVSVSLNQDPPEIIMNDSVDCALDVAILSAVEEGTEADHTFEWDALDGQFITAPNAARPKVTEAGGYSVIVERNDNGCKDNGDIELPLDVIQTTLRINIIRTTNGRNGKACYEVVDGVSPYTFEWFLEGETGPVANSSELRDTIWNVPLGRHYILATDGNGCQTRFDWTMWPAPTICEVPGISIQTETMINDTLRLNQFLPRSMRQLPCVDSVFNSTNQQLFYSAYFFDSPRDGDSIIVKFEADDYDKSRAFVVQCADSITFNQQICLGHTGIHPDSTFIFETKEPYYYIVVAGTEETEYSLSLNVKDPVFSVCNVEQMPFYCGVLDTFVSGDNQFDVNRGTYRACYGGGREYPGSEIALRIETDRLIEATFRLSTQDPMGAFLFDYRCSNTCITSFETFTGSNDASAERTIRLAPGLYILLIDNEASGMGNFTLEMSCDTIHIPAWPPRVDEERSPDCENGLNDTLVHEITFDLTTLTDYLVGNKPEDKWYIYALSPSQNEYVGDGLGPLKLNIFDFPETVDAVGDIPDDDILCGFLPGETIYFGLQRDGLSEAENVQVTLTNGELPFFRPGSDDQAGRIDSLSGLFFGHMSPTEHTNVRWDTLTTSTYVRSNLSWKILPLDPSVDWITNVGLTSDQNRTSGNNSASITITHDSNMTKEFREADIQIEFSNGVIQTFTIIQDTTDIVSSASYATKQIGFELRPNPTNDELFIQLNRTGITYDVRIMEIIDINGIVRHSIPAANVNKTGLERIDVSNLPPGIYNVVLKGANIFGSERVVIMR